MPPKQQPQISKAKEKKLKQKQESDRLKALSVQVKTAYEAANTDLLAPVAPFKTFDRNGLNLHFEVTPISKLSKELFQWIFDLLKKNMEKHYEEAWGWSDTGKRGELREDSALYLLAYTKAEKKEDEKPVAFAHFRFDYEQEKKVNVLYLYEIQLDESVRRKGLGKHMMQILELLAIKYSMSAVMLTVFRANTEALQFYQSLKYVIDEISPSKTHKALEDEAPVHEILSKSFAR